jgi:short-subunit dehydrogenase
MGAYVGTKHALEGLSASWRRELQLFGVPMVLIGLGVTKTPIWEKGMDLAAYRDTPYFEPAERFAKLVNRTRAGGLTPEYVAGRLVAIMETARPKVRYTIVPDHWRNLLTALLPARVLDKIIARGIGLRRPKTH